MAILESIIISVASFLFVGTQIILALFGLHYIYYLLKYLTFKRGTVELNNISASDVTSNGPKFKNLPIITIQLPIYNEKDLVKDLLQSLLNLNYPKNKIEIQILDDSTDETSWLIANEINKPLYKNFEINHIKRERRDFYKAGALNHGLSLAKGEYLAIFDSDFTIPENFLVKIVPMFLQNPNLGCVQARWGHKNFNESNFSNGIGLGIDGHFIIEQNVRSQIGTMNFNGTCGLWRKEAIIDAGGWDGSLLSEDLDLSYRAQLRNWKIVFREDIICRGEIPSISGWRTQQQRWAKGTSQALRKNLGSVLRSKNFSIGKKTESFFHHSSYFIQFTMLLLIFSTIPLMFFDQYQVLNLGYYFSALFIIAPLFFFITAYKLNYGLYTNIKSVLVLTILCIGISYSNSKAMISGLFSREHEFERTPKKGTQVISSYILPKNFSKGEVLIFLVLIFSLILGIINNYLNSLPILVYAITGFGYVIYLDIVEYRRVKSIISINTDKNSLNFKKLFVSSD